MFAMGKLHKDLAVSIIQSAQNEENSEPQVVQVMFLCGFLLEISASVLCILLVGILSCILIWIKMPSHP